MCAVLAKLLNFLAFSAVFPLSSCSGDDCKGGERGRGWEETYFFVCGLMPPPSSSGISRLSPAPDAAEPYVTVAPGNLFSTSSLTPDSSTATIKHRVISQLNQDCLWCLLRDGRDVGGEEVGEFGGDRVWEQRKEYARDNTKGHSIRSGRGREKMRWDDILLLPAGFPCLLLLSRPTLPCLAALELRSRSAYEIVIIRSASCSRFIVCFSFSVSFSFCLSTVLSCVGVGRMGWDRAMYLVGDGHGVLAGHVCGVIGLKGSGKVGCWVYREEWWCDVEKRKQLSMAS